MDKEFFILYFVASDALLSGRLVPCKWNQAWRPSELYMCIEREKDNFKSREVNCLKECALALRNIIVFIWVTTCILAWNLWFCLLTGCSDEYSLGARRYNDTWLWQTGYEYWSTLAFIPSTLLFWLPGEPNNFGSNENSMIIIRIGEVDSPAAVVGLNDVNGQQALPFICEKRNWNSGWPNGKK